MKFSMKLALSLTTCGLALMSVSQSAKATCSAEPYTGSICYTAATYCPQDYLDADGRDMQINSYQALYSLIGVQYGGSGSTFKLPDLRARLAIGQGPNLPQGTQRGADSVQLTVNQMPVHNHAAVRTTPLVTTVVVNASASNGTSAAPTAAENQLSALTGPAAKAYVAPGGTQVALSGTSATTTGGAIGVSNSGSSQPFSIIPTETTLRACIAVNGLYPPRP